MNILFIEAFYSGSHKTWLDNLINYSSHNISLLTMPGKFWKWRMYGASLTLAQDFENYHEAVDLIIVSDMIDLSTFLSLVHHKLHQMPKMPKIVLYFHENQFAYPWKDGSEDKSRNRDVHYGMMNYTSALCADYILYNSDYNQRSFLQGLEVVLNKMPDCKHNTIQGLRDKSQILPIGISPNSRKTEKSNISISNKLPLILWNHRLEHDKNPSEFLQVLIDLMEKGYKFQLAFLGEMNKTALKEYGSLLKKLESLTIAKGYLSKDDYLHYLDLADILPVTSNHDFFGISVMEAINHNCYPLLPNRLSYPDLYHIEENPEIFYNTKEELSLKLEELLDNPSLYKHKTFTHITKNYEWPKIIDAYDILFKNLSNR